MANIREGCWSFWSKIRLFRYIIMLGHISNALSSQLWLVGTLNSKHKTQKLKRTSQKISTISSWNSPLVPFTNFHKRPDFLQKYSSIHHVRGSIYPSNTFSLAKNTQIQQMKPDFSSRDMNQHVSIIALTSVATAMHDEIIVDFSDLLENSKRWRVLGAFFKVVWSSRSHSHHPISDYSEGRVAQS